ncbi:hypothetical protein, partial [Mycobacterium timonense]|uniref:hypothetical protein n=1 Tax=Mycobacterium timonense TaxID=701043 RepID=UPI001B807038
HAWVGAEPSLELLQPAVAAGPHRQRGWRLTGFNNPAPSCAASMRTHRPRVPDPRIVKICITK